MDIYSRIKNYFCLFFILVSSVSSAFEEIESDFVLETKRVIIPGYPDAFNPAIMRWQGRLLMSFRYLPDLKSKFTSHLGLVWLDEDFNLDSPVQILEMHQPESGIPPRSEELRFIQINDDVYIVYSDNKEEKISKGGFRVYIGKLVHDGAKFSVTQIECLDNFSGHSRAVREKNWVPFSYQGELLLAYSLTPHRILKPLLDLSGRCEDYCETDRQIEWDWGLLRGGTQALDLGEGEYLAFFHSSVKMRSEYSGGEEMLHYFMGAYMFKSSPPFEITRYSPEPIMSKGFYSGDTYKPYWHPIRAVFPCGFISNSSYIWVSYGRQDHELWIVKLDRKKLLDSLVYP